MTTETMDQPTQRQLLPRREKKATGMPTSGLMLLVGYPKSGKTKLAASFPDSYVFELEKAGADRVEGRIEEVADLATLREGFAAAYEAEDIRTIVLDTVDVFSEWHCNEIAQNRGLTKITERKAGVDGFEMWGELFERFVGLIKKIKESDKLFILNAHLREPKLDDNNNVITPAGINIPGKSGDKLLAEADIIGYTFKKQVGGATEYSVSFQGGPLGRWGSRIEELNDKTIRLDSKDPYSSFAALFATAATNGHKPAAATKTAAKTAARKR